MKKIILILTLIGLATTAILQTVGVINLFKNKSSNKPNNSIKIKGFVYKNNQKEPCRECTVIVKEVQNVIPEKSVDGNGFYISDPLKKEDLIISNNSIDCTIQIKLNGIIIEERTKRIDFKESENEFSFGDLILQRTESKNTTSSSQPKFKAETKQNNGTIIQAEKVNIKNLGN